MNVIHLNDFVIFRKHLCIGFELMSMNLFEFLKINDFNVSILLLTVIPPLPAYSCLFLYLLGFRPQLDPKVRHPASLCSKVSEDVPDNPLRSQA